MSHCLKTLPWAVKTLNLEFFLDPQTLWTTVTLSKCLVTIGLINRVWYLSLKSDTRKVKKTLMSATDSEVYQPADGEVYQLK